MTLAGLARRLAKAFSGLASYLRMVPQCYSGVEWSKRAAGAPARPSRWGGVTPQAKGRRWRHSFGPRPERGCR